jgi:FkbM family methyltransferase
MFPFHHGLAGIVNREVPSGEYGDGVYGGVGEYASLLTAIENRRGSSFTAVELGAAWGPWISAIGIVCKRLGLEQINLRGVEADHGKCEHLRQHFERNGLIDGKSVSFQAIEAAVWKEDTTVKFPVIDSLRDMGAAATDRVGATDYRGKEVEFVDIAALSLNSICRGLSIVDYMHWDIQGAEREIIRPAKSFLNERVRFLFIGTHSRVAEGEIISFFYENQWDVMFEKPCEFSYDRRLPSMEGMLRKDGEIFAVNPKLL